jgi:hypothetical protein
MPSVGGTAEDLKMEATQIAQNIVNSFVSCFYFNDAQTGKLCDDPSYYLVQRGYAFAGEVISNISKQDADKRALQLADSRTICISPDLIGGGAGCDETEISNAEGGSNIGNISLNFAKAGCSFTPTLTFGSLINFKSITFKQITVCSSTGASVDIYVPDWGADEANIRLAYREDL